MFQRREFLRAAAAASAGVTSAGLMPTPASARGPIPREGPPRMHLALAAYSFHRYFRWMKGKRRKPAAGPDGQPTPMTMPRFVDYCANLGVPGAELTSYFFEPGDDGFPTDDSLLAIRRQAFLSGVIISGTAIGNNFTVAGQLQLRAQIDDAKRWIDKAVVLGAPHIRFFAGTARQIEGHPERLQQAARAMQQCGDHAAEAGIMLGVENHGGLNADQMLRIMKSVDSPAVGINLDTGNFVAEDPYEELRRCVPYAVNVQVKVMMRRPDRSRYPADLSRIGKILKDGGYQGFVALEFEEDSPYDEIPATMDRLRQAIA